MQFHNNNNKKYKNHNNKSIYIFFIIFIFIIFIIFYNNNKFLKIDNTTSNLDSGEDIIENTNYNNLHFHSNENKNNKISNKIITNNQQQQPNQKWLISIIIPIYNNLKYLKYTLNSLVESTFKEFQVIIVDDSSTEWNSKITLNSTFEKYKSQLNLSIIYNNLNMGLSYSRNIGIEHSTSTWILPLDSDDLIDKSFLTQVVKQINSIKNKDNQQDDGDNYVIISNLSRFKNSEKDDKEGYINKIGDWKIPKWNRLLLKNTNLLHSSGIFKKSMWLKINGYDESFWFGWEDWDFWLRADRYFYNQHNNGTTDELTYNTFYSGLNPLIINEDLFYYRLKNEKSGLHSFCKENFKLCFSMFQTLHPMEYSVEELLLSHKYIGKIGNIGTNQIKNSLINQINKYPKNSITYFWLALIYHYGDDNDKDEMSNTNKINIRNLYQKSIDYQINDQLKWQMKLQKSLIELETLHFNQAKKDLSSLFQKYSNLQLNDKVNRIYQINI